LCGLVLWAAGEAELALAARLLADGLGRAPVAVSLDTETPAYADVRPAPPGVGWPT
jgi:hypothetical protein